MLPIRPNAAEGINGDGQVNTGDLVLGARILTGLHLPTVPEQTRFGITPLSGAYLCRMVITTLGITSS
jgi:hypothetical protein